MSKSFVSTAALSLLSLLAGGAHAAPLQLSADVDTAFCASGAVQCSLAGHSATAASDLNHNPLRLFVTVVRKSGVPLGALPLTAFSFANGLVPAGGGSASICSEASCGTARFSANANGLYSIMLDRAAAGNWKAGTYAATLTATSGADQGTALVTFTIPDAP